ncbi:MAG TPA: hypothetical protein VM638_03675, partial [Actinomycetota bacterium]|nr:hypothetical protein [Actinomycetota bacterium]
TISPIQDGLRFTWHLSSMPEQTLLEGIRYTWSFKIGETNYQLQAKRVNLASTTTVEDPVGHVNRATSQQDFFQLRGACEPQYQGLPLAGCYHLTFLNGAFDPANKQVRVDLPFRARDRLGRIVAEDFVPGVVLESSLQAGASISAAFQAVVTYNDYPVTQLGRGFMSTYINEWSPYYIGGRVQLGVGSHLASPADVTYGSPVTLSAGRFTATISGLSSTNNTVFVRACNGVTCSYASKRLIGG